MEKGKVLTGMCVRVMLLFRPKRTLFTGNRHGQVYSFVLPDTSDTLHLLKEDRCKECTQCRKSFSVLGKRSFESRNKE
jgi:hypothetical protein